VEGIDETAGARKKGRGKLSPSRSRSSAHDDTVKHYRGGPNDIIHDGQKNQYQVVTEVGIGTFGRVLKCMDLRRRDFVAIKIVRDVKRYYESALVEARIMQDINRQGGRGLSHCVRLFDSFTFHGHYCMVLENLGPSLYDFLKKHEYQPFPMICVQDFTVQLLATLEFLHSLRLIHTDLKIENILLMNDRETIHNQQRVPESTRIKVIDFGGACYDSDKKSSLINTRQYRAPEVILGTGWSMPSDIWSLGCLLVELYQGDLLFATHDNYEHLALVERIIGPFPRNMIKDARSGSNCITVSNVFDSAGHMHRLDSILSPDSARFVRKTESLSDIIRNPNDEWFLNLLRRMLVIDPGQRLTAHECLRYLSRLRRDVVRCA
jgi:serine/threonine protein kinase